MLILLVKKQGHKENMSQIPQLRVRARVAVGAQPLSPPYCLWVGVLSSVAMKSQSRDHCAPTVQVLIVHVPSLSQQLICRELQIQWA